MIIVSKVKNLQLRGNQMERKLQIFGKTRKRFNMFVITFEKISKKVKTDIVKNAV